MCDAAPGRRQSVVLDEFGTGMTCPGLRRRGWAESRATLDTSARSTREDGGAPWTVPSESTRSWLSPPWPYWRRRPSGCCRGRFVPQVVLLLVDGIVIGPYVLGLGTPADGQVLAGVGLGFRVRLAGYEIDLGLFGQDAGRRAAAADSPQSGSPSRPVPTPTTRSPPHRRGRLTTVRPRHTALPHGRGSNARVRAPAAPPARTHHTAHTEHNAPTDHTAPTEHTAHPGQEDTDVNQAHA
jgi:hypothetical protein